MSEAREYPFGRLLAEMDIDAFMAIRSWLADALVAKGAEMEALGIGAGAATVCINHEGMRYEVSIRPLDTGGGHV